MPSHLKNALETMTARIGEEEILSEWTEVTQDMINQFADITGDHQWIHTDVERARNGPFGAPIAHGHLTLAAFCRPRMGAPLPGKKMGINYGLNRVRFPAPVPVGARIRSRRILREVTIKAGMLELVNEVIVDIEGSPKPACISHAVSRQSFADA